MFLNFYLKHCKNMDKNTELQMFPIAIFRHYTRKEYLTRIIKNKSLPFVKTKHRNVLNLQIKTAECNLPMRNKSYL